MIEKLIVQGKVKGKIPKIRNKKKYGTNIANKSVWRIDSDEDTRLISIHRYVTISKNAENISKCHEFSFHKNLNPQ